MKQKRQPHSYLIIWSLLSLASLLSILLSISFGSTHTGWSQWIGSLLQPHSLLHIIVFKLRLPRTICAFITGGLLALAGALMQTLFRNPLADPFILGISGGAAVMSLIAIMLGLAANHIALWAFVGSLFSIYLVMVLARVRKRGWSPLHLLLTGVVVATGWSAIISLILTISPDNYLHSMLFWLMGDLSYAKFAWWQPAVLIVSLIASLMLAKPLNVLAQGDLSARSLGIDTHKLNFILFIISSLLTAAAVSIAGTIGFIGLIVPHMLRLMVGTDHRIILPASVLLGGSLLTFADTLARSLVAPVQLPVGIVTAIIGVPSFLILLQRGYQK